MKHIHRTKNPAETKTLAKKLKINNSANGMVLALKGDLGGGKTTFVQGLAKALGVKEKILSPTFNIFKKFNNFYHFDCYRIKNSRELLKLGFKEIVSNPKNIIAIEWAEKVKDILPKNAVWVSFKFIDKTTREIVIKYPNARK